MRLKDSLFLRKLAVFFWSLYVLFDFSPFIRFVFRIRFVWNIALCLVQVLGAVLGFSLRSLTVNLLTVDTYEMC